eukprot:TRINITY_DN68330_c0_g1_i1.p1 TRINITY_DN68330_c0_g1~~TRINITY_DN68330_c0_g1_i1.p1  ORF type:complete len:890 (-),score=137.08 TRINITY_DN68330_c0_g1_i1:2-2671(-)
MKLRGDGLWLHQRRLSPSFRRTFLIQPLTATVGAFGANVGFVLAAVAEVVVFPVKASVLARFSAQLFAAAICCVADAESVSASVSSSRGGFGQPPLESSSPATPLCPKDIRPPAADLTNGRCDSGRRGKDVSSDGMVGATGSATTVAFANATLGDLGLCNCESGEFPSAVEWRVAPQVGSLIAEPMIEHESDCAVCILGVPRFIDATAILMRRNLLQQLGLRHDMFVFASVGRNKRTCERFGTKGPGWHENLKKLEHIFLSRPGINGTAYVNEWDALATFLDEAVAARVVWDDRPLELLAASTVWRKAGFRPGAWLGGISDGGNFGSDVGAERVRPGAGAAQLRALQWCADAVQWHEANVLRHRYAYVLYSRWDLQWLIPFPGIPLLRSMHSSAVWLPVTTGDFLANDRFGVVPRQYISAYFEGWKLLVSGQVEDLFETVISGSGRPVFFAENTNCEAFLYARLKYAGATVGDLPASSYVYCTPSEDWQSLRTLGWFSCTAIRELMQNQMLSDSLGGVKYAVEFQNVLITDHAVRGRYNKGFKSFEAEETTEAVAEQLTRLHGQGSSIAWTSELMEKATFIGSQMEIARYLRNGTSCADAEQVRFRTLACTAILRRLLKLSHSRGELLLDAWSIAKALVIAAPLHLEHWLWLAIVLVHPYMSAGRKFAAAAALLEAQKLNRTHPAVVVLSTSVGENARHVALTSDKGLIEAFDDANATRNVRKAQEETRRLLALRRRLQRSCADQRGAPLPAADAVDAWLQLGENLLRENWLLGVAGVLKHLEAEFLLDARPEEVRRRGDAAARISDLAARFHGTLSRAIWGTWGVSPDDFRQHAPTAEELVSKGWLRHQEERTTSGGHCRKALVIRNVGYVWSSTYKAMVLGDIDRFG